MRAPTERLHALDNLRALMMWLGIVLHVAAIYTVAETPLPWRDRQQSQWADLLMAWIHSFRMPVFFIVAGFFVVLLVQKRGVSGMVKNRLLRLGAPFALLWPPLFVACGVFALLFLHRMARGTWGLDESLLPHTENTAIPSTVHLWFIWMLLWFCLLTALLVPLARRVTLPMRQRLARGFERCATSLWGLALLAVPLAAVGTLYRDGILTVNGSFLPPWTEWLHNGLFFAFGLALYACRTPLLAHYQRHWGRYGGVGLVFFTASVLLMGAEHEHLAHVPHYAWWSALLYNLCTWYWSVAWLGLFLRHVHAQSPVLRYLSQASYWVYLIHMPLTIGFGALLYEAPLSALGKVAVNIVATSVVSMLSYHLVVRSTALGQLLTGQRHAFTGWGTRGAAR